MRYVIISILFAAIVISGCTGGWRWFIPKNFEPSYHKFKELCELNPKTYLANELDDKFYNKVLAYFDTNINELDWNNKNNLRTNDRGILVYRLKKYFEDDRIEFSIGFYFRDKNAKKSDIDKVSFYVSWRDLRPRLAGNEGTGFYLSGDREMCTNY